MIHLILILIISYSIILVPRYIKFKNSKYKDISGNRFINIIFDKGNFGEFLTFYELEKISNNGLILSNLYIKKNDSNTTEIDLLMIDETGIYVFESKNFSGWIYGDESQKNWTQTLNKKQKNRFYNPIWQNYGHITALKKLLNIENDNFFKSYIVFSERCTLKKIKAKSNKAKVLKRDNLLSELKSDIKTSNNIISKSKMKDIYNQLKKYTLASEKIKSDHIKNINNKKSVKM